MNHWHQLLYGPPCQWIVGAEPQPLRKAMQNNNKEYDDDIPAFPGIIHLDESMLAYEDWHIDYCQENADWTEINIYSEEMKRINTEKIIKRLSNLTGLDEEAIRTKREKLDTIDKRRLTRYLNTAELLP